MRPPPATITPRGDNLDDLDDAERAELLADAFDELGNAAKLIADHYRRTPTRTHTVATFNTPTEKGTN